MSAINLNFTIGAGATVRLPAGRFFMIRTASSAVDVETVGNPTSRVRLLGLTAGCRFGPVSEGEGWTYLQVTSAAAQVLEFVISDDGVFDVANVVTVAGAVSITESPSSAVTSPAPLAVATGTAQTVAANLARRRVSLCSPSSNSGVVFVQLVGAGAGRGIELSPGVTIEFRTTAALDIRNDSGATQNINVFEET